MHLVLCADDNESFLAAELRRVCPAGAHAQVAPLIWSFDGDWLVEAPPRLVFARQLLPEAVEAGASSITGWAQRLLEHAVERAFNPDQPWLLHVEPHYGSGTAGRNRCRLVTEALREKLRRRHRPLLRSWRTEPECFTPAHTLVQLILTEPEAGFLSLAVAPRPHQLRAILSPFPKGEIPIAVDKAAPSRAFAKLVEAEQRLGRRMSPGETCVDLGAAPGSWTYVALNRGAHVIAVDRAPLRADLMRHPFLRFHRGDAFAYKPDAPVDWLICDVIAAPERSIELILDWVRHQRTRYFVVTIKFKGHEEYARLEQLKHALPPFCEEFFLSRLCANKNEACAFGAVRKPKIPGKPPGLSPVSLIVNVPPRND